MRNLSGKKVLITAGPTIEPIDPVRFIGNHASGQMGFAIAEELFKLGAEVRVVSGPSPLQLKSTAITRVDVTSAEEMEAEMSKHFGESDITVMSAAVADYRPKSPSESKIKKDASEFNIELVKTVDILSGLGKLKRNDQILVGFALETNDEEQNAFKKLEKKNL